MSVPVSLSPRRRDLVLALVGLALVTAPFWIGQFDLDDPRYTYERTAVTTDNGTIEYANAGDSAAVSGPISEDIGCLRGFDLGEIRYCTIEGSIATNETTVTIAYTSDSEPDSLHRTMGSGSYRYLAVNGGIYVQTVRVDRSAGGNESAARYPVYLDLERADPEAALEDVSIERSSADVSPTVARAAETGSETTRSEIEVPQQPIRLEDGSYYRVYLEETTEPTSTETLLSLLARFVAPISGLVLFANVFRRVRVTYVGDEDGDGYGWD